MRLRVPAVIAGLTTALLLVPLASGATASQGRSVPAKKAPLCAGKSKKAAIKAIEEIGRASCRERV